MMYRITKNIRVILLIISGICTADYQPTVNPTYNPTYTPSMHPSYVPTVLPTYSPRPFNR